MKIQVNSYNRRLGHIFLYKNSYLWLLVGEASKDIVHDSLVDGVVKVH